MLKYQGIEPQRGHSKYATSGSTAANSQRGDQNQNTRNPRMKRLDILSPLICVFPIGSAILGQLSPRAVFRLINTSKRIRNEILRVHFSRLRNLSIIKDLDYYNRLTPSDLYGDSGNGSEWNSDNEDEPLELTGMGYMEKVNPKDIFFSRFGDFNFEEFVIGKLMEMPTNIHPTADQDVLRAMDFTRALTKLCLDGTKVSGIGLFGAVRMTKSGLPQRETPGLISYFAATLTELSVQHCPNIEHCDIAIYLLLPPTTEVSMRSLRKLKVFNAGEAPAVGPFHNKRGYGSRGKVATNADHVNSLNVLKVMFPVALPLQHHLQWTLSAIIPQNIPNGGKAGIMGAIQLKLVKQHQAGWFAPANIHGTRIDLLQDPKSGETVPGPWGGDLSEVHESLILYSVCKFRKVQLDWGFCINGNKCHAWNLAQLQNVSHLNARSGRSVALGNMYGRYSRRNNGIPSWWSQGNGPVTSLPVLLATEPGFPSKPQVQALSRAQRRPYPQFLSLNGPTYAPLPSVAPNSEGITTVIGLNGVGLHTHCATGFEQRKACGGQVCANCGLWETQHSRVTTPEGNQIIDMGRRYRVGEVCEICVVKHTCCHCGKYVVPGKHRFLMTNFISFYCPSCLFDEKSTKMPFPKNPFACDTPTPGFLLHPCRHHGAVCRTCFEGIPSGCNNCGKYLCMECAYEECMDQPFEQCRECQGWYCLECMYQGQLDSCDGERCHDGKDLWRRGGRLQGCCTPCMIGECLECKKIYCRTDVTIIQRKYFQKYGVQIQSTNGRFFCLYCFEEMLLNAKSDSQRAEAWTRVGIDILQRKRTHDQANQSPHISAMDHITRNSSTDLQTPHASKMQHLSSTPPSGTNSSSTLFETEVKSPKTKRPTKAALRIGIKQTIAQLQHLLRTIPASNTVSTALKNLRNLREELNSTRSTNSSSPLAKKVLGVRKRANDPYRVSKRYKTVQSGLTPVKKLNFRQVRSALAVAGEDPWAINDEETNFSDFLSASSDGTSEISMRMADNHITECYEVLDVHNKASTVPASSMMKLCDVASPSSSFGNGVPKLQRSEVENMSLLRQAPTTVNHPPLREILQAIENVAADEDAEMMDVDAIMDGYNLTREEMDAIHDVRRQKLKDMYMAEEELWVSDSEGEDEEVESDEDANVDDEESESRSEEDESDEEEDEEDENEEETESVVEEGRIVELSDSEDENNEVEGEDVGEGTGMEVEMEMQGVDDDEEMADIGDVCV